LIHVAYLPIATLLFRALFCDTQGYLINEPNIKCQIDYYTPIYYIAGIGILCYVIGIPILVLWVYFVFYKQKITKPWAEFLFVPYRLNCWYYEAFTLILRFAISIVISAFSPNSISLPIIISILLLVHFDFQRKKEALKSKVDYYLELFSLILLVINFIETSLDLSLQSQLQNEIYLQWIILICNLGLGIVMFIWLTLRQFWDPLKNWAVFRQRADDYARMSQYYNATVAVDNQVNVNLLGAQQSLEPEITNVNDNYENYENTNETNNT